jgi:hypothetical protein
VAKTAAWQRKAGKNPKGGLNAAGVASSAKAQPWHEFKCHQSQSKQPNKTRSAARRKSFCARMGGMPGPMRKPNGKPTRKALALRKWD